MMKLEAKGRVLNIAEEDFVVIEALCELVKQKTLKEADAGQIVLLKALDDMAQCISQKDWKLLKPETRFLFEGMKPINGKPT